MTTKSQRRRGQRQQQPGRRALPRGYFSMHQTKGASLKAIGLPILVAQDYDFLKLDYHFF